MIVILEKRKGGRGRLKLVKETGVEYIDKVGMKWKDHQERFERTQIVSYTWRELGKGKGKVRVAMKG